MSDAETFTPEELASFEREENEVLARCIAAAKAGDESAKRVLVWLLPRHGLPPLPEEPRP